MLALVDKDNDLRCRVTKRGNKIWGLEDSEAKRAWMKNEFVRRRAKREAKEKARVSDEAGLNMGAGSSSVFQAAYTSSPPPMSATNTSPIFSNFQTPFSDSQEDETRVAVQDLVSLLPRAMEPEAPIISEPSRSSIAQSEHGGIGDLAGDGSEDSMSVEQLNSLIGNLREADEPANTSIPHSTSLLSLSLENELLPGAVEPEAPIISEPSRSSIAQSEYGGIRDPAGDGSEDSMSLEQVNPPPGKITESMGPDEPANTSIPHFTSLLSHHQVADPTSNWPDCQFPSAPSVDTTSRGTKRRSPDDPSSLSKRTCKPPSKNLIVLTQFQATLQSSDRSSQSVSRHQVNSSYAASFGNSENMNRRLMKPPPYHPASKPPPIGITTGPGSVVASHAKSNEHEKKIKSMGFPPLMAGMKPK